MAKRNLIKGIVCGLMLTTVLGSAAFAGTLDEEGAAYKKNVNKSYFGAAGTYITEGDIDWFKLTARSSSGSYKLYKVEVCEKHLVSGQVSDLDAEAVTQKSGSKVTAAILRTWDEPSIKYVSTATTYNSTSEATGVVDNYKYTVVQVQ